MLPGSTMNVLPRGGMKKTSSATTAASGGKKTLTVQWADQNGGLLREVRTIEVERIKRSTAHYSNTRELSKKERQSEKESHLLKVS